MSDVPMPQGLSQEAVAEWARSAFYNGQPIGRWGRISRAVLALVEAKVREGVRETIRVLDEIDLCDEDERTIIARVMNKEVKRG